MPPLRRVVVWVAGLSLAALAGCQSSRSDGADAGIDAAAPTGSGGASTAGTGGTQAGSGGSAEIGGRSGAGGQAGGAGAPAASDGGADAGVDANRDTGGPGDANPDAGDSGRGDATDATGADGGAPFAPCPTGGAACVILPFGDSITDGFPAENGGYRVELFHRTLAAAKHVTFVGSLSNGPLMVDNVAFPPNHEGHSGFSIDPAPNNLTPGGISPLANGAIATYHPNIILLLIGTNDVNRNIDLANAPTRLAALVDRIIADAPNALLAVGQLIPITDDTINVRVRAYNAAIPGIVQQRAAAGKHVILVNAYDPFASNANFKTALMTDVLHPNLAGYGLLGDTWYNAISSYLR